MKIFDHFYNSFIPSNIDEEDVWEVRKHKLFISVSFVSAFYALLYLPTSILENYFQAVYVIIFFLICNASFPFILKKGVPLKILSNAYILVLGISLARIMAVSGGVIHTATDPQLMVIMPMMALLFLNFKSAIFWFIIAFLIVISFGLMQLNGHVFPILMDAKYIKLQTLLAAAGHLVLVFMIINIFENQKNIALKNLSEKNKLVEEEKKRSDDLLLNILPSEIVTELKETGKSKAKLFDHVSVIFTDFVNFTKISEHLNPDELVSEIDYCFKGIDEIIEKNGLEKIKTIGDAYLAVCGLPNEDNQHAHKTIRAGMEILEFIEERKKNGGKFDIRVGVHSGPLVAGIVGVKKFAYDIWGDTVNTASRMESSGEQGKLNISATTYELIKDDYICEYRGKIEAKNKGQIDMYFALSAK